MYQKTNQRNFSPSSAINNQLRQRHLSSLYSIKELCARYLLYTGWERKDTKRLYLPIKVKVLTKFLALVMSISGFLLVSDHNDRTAVQFCKYFTNN